MLSTCPRSNRLLLKHVSTVRKQLLRSTKCSSIVASGDQRRFLSNSILEDPNSSSGAKPILNIPPTEHTESHEGMFYRVTDEKCKTLYNQSSFRPEFHSFRNSVRRTDLMIRKAFLDVRNIVDRLNFALPAARILLYGMEGSGKTVTLAHLVHYFHDSGYVVLNLPLASRILRYHLDVNASAFHNARIDLPMISVDWLNLFLSQNKQVLTTHEDKLRTTRKFQWNEKESTAADEPLLNLIEFGIKRPKFANDCMEAIIEEMKILSPRSGIRTAVLVDEINSFWHITNIPVEDGSQLPAKKLSLVEAFKKAVSNDWSNSVIICSVDNHWRMTGVDYHSEYSPRSLLQQEGWDFFDPFLPVHVKNFSREECLLYIEHMRNVSYVFHEGAASSVGQDELSFLSGGNPLDLFKLCEEL